MSEGGREGGRGGGGRKRSEAAATAAFNEIGMTITHEERTHHLCCPKHTHKHTNKKAWTTSPHFQPHCSVCSDWSKQTKRVGFKCPKLQSLITFLYKLV